MSSNVHSGVCVVFIICLLSVASMGKFAAEAGAGEPRSDVNLIVPEDTADAEPYNQYQLGVLEDGTVVWLGEKEIIPLVRPELHFYENSWQPILANQDELAETVVEDDAVVQTYTMGGKVAEGATLTVRYRSTDEGLSITWKADVSEELEERMGGNTRWLFSYPGEDPVPHPLGIDTPEDSPEVKNLDFGPATLSMDFGTTDFKWHNSQNRLQVKLQGPSRETIVGEGITIDISLEEQSDLGLANIENPLEDVSAYIEVIEYRDIDTDGFTADLDAIKSQLDKLYSELDAVEGNEGDAPDNPIDRWNRVNELDSSAHQLREDIRELLWANRDTLYEYSREHNEQLHYAVGFSTDERLPDELPKYALFGINTYRHAPGRLGKREDVENTFEDKMRAYTELLEETDEFGGEAMYIGGGGARMDRPEDITWNQNFLPQIRASFWKPNFNSQRIRDGWAEWAERIAPVLNSADNVRIIQLGNEPFWHLSPYPQVGYNPPEIGCSNETWVENLLQHYDSEEEWLAAIEDWKADVKENVPGFKRERFFSDGDHESVVPWNSLEEVHFDPDNITGYNFVDFLQERHGDLETLNEVWFGDDESRYFASWEDVFPPIPTEEGGTTESHSLGAVPDSWVAPDRTVRPVEEDIPGYVDWKNMHGYYASDSHSEFRDYLIEAGVEDPLITTNAVMGHYINDFNFTASNSGCYPWITMDGLGAHGIDFYSIAYMQAYVASLRDADVNRDTPDRPAWVHEIRWGGNRNKEGPHIAMFCFAHGIDGLVFFDHDRDFFPRDTVGLAKLMDAMNDEKLQYDTEPVTDGVAALYSLDSLWVADALTGSGRPYIVNFQSTVTTLDRMQVLYNVYADRQIENGVPENVSVLMAPGVDAITDDAYDAIRSFVEEEDGILVTTPSFAGVDRYNRQRPDVEREWFQNSDNVVILQGEDLDNWLEDWQRGQYEMQRGLGWANKPLPDVAEPLEEVISEKAPRTVRYLDSDGNMDARKTGARIAEDGTLYVFVDPWAEDVSIAVPGEFSEASNLYRDESVTLQMVDGEARVEVESGPAIIRLDP